MLTYRPEWVRVVGNWHKLQVQYLNINLFEITFLRRLCQGIKEGIVWLKEVRANWFAE